MKSNRTKLIGVDIRRFQLLLRTAYGDSLQLVDAPQTDGHLERPHHLHIHVHHLLADPMMNIEYLAMRTVINATAVLRLHLIACLHHRPLFLASEWHHSALMPLEYSNFSGSQPILKCHNGQEVVRVVANVSRNRRLFCENAPPSASS